MAEQLRVVNALGDVILEPVGKNSAPVNALAPNRTGGPDPLMLVFPTDHLIVNREGFAKAVMRAIRLREARKLISFGNTPFEARTGYGYIKAGDSVEARHEEFSFKEKPGLKPATGYLNYVGYY